MKETGTHEASPVSDVLSVTTEKASLSGAVTVSGTATFGQMLTAVTAGLTSIPFVVLGTLSYQWKRDGSDISGATGSTYTLAVEDVGKAVTVTVTAANCTGSITSGATAAVAKAAQSAPAAPTLADKTETSVTLNTIPGAQYRNGTDGTWQDSPTFTDLDPNTAYTFYARMKETGTHEASPVSDVLSVITFGSEAELTGLTVNGVPVSIAGDTSVYSAECDETSVVLEILSSARVTVNGAEYTGQGITLTNDLMEINIRLTSGYGQKTYDHRLKVTKALDAGLVLFQRWDDVISLILNPENNGNRNLEGVRWYRKGSEEVLGTEWFIRITGDAEDYSAEISIDGNWHQVCGEPGTKSAVKIIAYPNPVSVGDNLTLQLPDSFTGGYANVISLSGATVKQRLPLPDRVSTVNVSDCSPGIYLLSIISPDGNSETVKIAINN
jgi:hypothetical protein